MHLPQKLVNLLLISAGFLIALAIYNPLAGGLGPWGMVAGTAISILAFWVAVEVRNAGRVAADPPWVVFVEEFCLGTGVNLLLHSVVTYVFYTRRTPLLITLGGLLSAGFLTLNARRNAAKGRAHQRFLLLGFDAITQKVLEAIHNPVIGVVAGDPAVVPAGFAYLGDFTALEEILSRYQPTNIVVEMREWTRRLAPSVLLNCRLAGAEVEGAPVLYERVFHRVCCELLRPGDLILSPSLRGDARTIAVQSVYTNLIALSLLLLFSPVMLLAGLSVFLFSGPGPVFESVECAGFQHIPFRRLRFRTARLDGSGEMTVAGRWISRLHLRSLPQLFNVVRGDLALVGPAAVRLEFARYLADAMPFYAHRFSVKPGLVGWAQLHSRGNPVPDECRQIEYDLFYVKEASLWTDMEIMLSSVSPVRKTGLNS